MKPHLKEAFAKDNREAYLRNKAKNNGYYQKNREKMLEIRKATVLQIGGNANSKIFCVWLISAWFSHTLIAFCVNHAI